MNTKVLLWLTILNAILITLVIIFGITEAIVPIHYGMNGEPDSFGSKWTYLLFAFIPFFLLGGIEKYNQRQTDNPNAEINKKYEKRILPALLIFFILLGWYFTINVAKNNVGIDLFFPNLLAIGFGLLMLVISNYMAKIKPNHMLGIRVPWTLNNEEVWKKTHRLAGYTGVLGSMCMIGGGIAGLISGNIVCAPAGIIVGVFLDSVIPCIYAWAIYPRNNS